jgi:hypothetical protein
MPACVDGAVPNGSNPPPGLSLYIPLPLRSDPKAENCAWVVQSGEEFAKAQSEQQELEAMFLPCILVVIFVLGWIAGAQR